MKKIGIILALVVIAVVFWGRNLSQKNVSPQAAPTPTPQSSGSLESLQTGPYPWSTEIETLKDRLIAISLPALKTEGSVLHTHQHLDIFVEGKQVSIPPEIGINESANFISPIHTHDPDSIIHVESPKVETFTLGQFFDVWGVRFNDNCIGGYCQENEKQLEVYVNGKKVEKDYRNISLEERQEIVIVFGNPDQSPKNIPSQYSFPAGL